jgi:arylsulfatase A-like enzyme
VRRGDYQPAIGVPLVMRHPARIPAGARVEAPVTTLGVFATIVDLAGVEAPPTLHAGSLLRVLQDGGPGGGTARPFLAEVLDPGSPRPDLGDPQMRGHEHLRALRDGRFKLVESSAGERFLYDLEADPSESRDLAAEQPDRVRALAARLEAERVRLGLPPLDRVGEGATAEVDEATKERLRELGYVE